jgi:hypothetical protein
VADLAAIEVSETSKTEIVGARGRERYQEHDRGERPFDEIMHKGSPQVSLSGGAGRLSQSTPEDRRSWRLLQVGDDGLGCGKLPRIR